jgi:hypothetical protein
MVVIAPNIALDVKRSEAETSPPSAIFPNRRRLPAPPIEWADLSRPEVLSRPCILLNEEIPDIWRGRGKKFRKTFLASSGMAGTILLV